MEVQVKTLSTTLIKPYWRNPRKVTNDAIEKVATSIAQYGYNNLITVDEHNVIITGHTRFAALRRLGWEEIPVQVITHLDPKKIKEYRIADNKASEYGKWDDALLIQELREIADLDDLQVFFPQEDLAAWVGAEAGTDWKQGAVTGSTIAEREAKMNGSISESANYEKTQFITLLCPHCNEEFQVKKGDVLKEINIQ